MLLVIGAGPYGVATAALALQRGIETTIVGRPMSFWTDNMPADMFLRSGPDWHLDASEEHTFEAFLAQKAITPADIDPVPRSVFLEYASWFQAEKGVAASGNLVDRLESVGGSFRAELDDGRRLVADAVVATPGVGYFTRLPQWAGTLPVHLWDHTCDLVGFDDVDAARVLVVGGRQSVYEWAALLGEHGAARVDIVHRHPAPRFGRVSWQFVEPYMERTMSVPGWWQTLSERERRSIEREFWAAGRLTLEWWLEPRIADRRCHRWPGTFVTDAACDQAGLVRTRLSNGEMLTVDRVVFATGYDADLARVPYLSGLLDRIAVEDGFPVLDEGFQSTLPGLYVPGFAATRDFGPFFGFTRGCPAAAALIVDHLCKRG